eukprot:6181569-Pleurochrysis_carterae.AAC.8
MDVETAVLQCKSTVLAIHQIGNPSLRPQADKRRPRQLECEYSVRSKLLCAARARHLPCQRERVQVARRDRRHRGRGGREHRDGRQLREESRRSGERDENSVAKLDI